MPEKELPLGKGRRPELAGDSESNKHEFLELGLCCLENHR